MIRVENLSKSYGAINAIHDVSFEVARGEIVGFLGPNGAGKTTTMKILTGYMPPSAGKAEIDGFEVLEHPIEVKRRIGYLPESVPLYQSMTVERFLGFVAEAKQVAGRERSKEVDRVAETCGLRNVRKRIISHLSKGYRQRVGLAQALINNPPLLILDEPTIGLDPAQIVEIRNLILGLRESHTVLLSSHILPEVSQMCERVVIINKGRIVATDTPSNLMADTQQGGRLRVEVKGPQDEVAPALECISGVAGVSKNRETDAYEVRLQPGNDPRAAIARDMVNRGWDLMGLERVAVSLEDVFMQLVTEENGEAA
ncbi:MAG: ATP-binding cassette domain-containing protein [Deltaproteobacteria bacterium]|nr:ATP-binding cassette domain-containing protein [Deltaproteobacteria bacterium]